jgi:hypothetical protein
MAGFPIQNSDWQQISSKNAYFRGNGNLAEYAGTQKYDWFVAKRQSEARK